MIICGIDIGIKNLALCIIDTDLYNPSSFGTMIIYWKSLNILPNDHLCSATKKSGIQCVRKAKYLHHSNYFCGTHKPNNASVYTPKKLNSYTSNQILELCFEHLYKQHYFDTYTIDAIVIELQPTFNFKMRFLSHGIHSFFMLESIRYNKKIKHVSYSHAKNKMKVLKWFKFSFHSSKKRKYDQTKEASIECVKYLLQSNANTMLNDFLIHTKQDDLADAFLHSLYFAIQKKYISIPV